MNEILGLASGTPKGEGPGHKEGNKALSDMLKTVKEISKNNPDTEVARQIKELAKLGQYKEIDKILNGVNTLNSNTAKAKGETNNLLQRVINDRTNQNNKDVVNAINRNTNFTKIGNTKEAVDSSNERKIETTISKATQDTTENTKLDLSTGFNTDAKAQEAIDAIRNINANTTYNKPLALPPGRGENDVINKDDQASLGKLRKKYVTYGMSNDQILQKLADTANQRKGKGSIWGKENPPIETEPINPRTQKSKIYASIMNPSIFDKFRETLADITGQTKKFGDALNATAEDQDRMAAERIRRFGLNNGRNPTDTGDIAGMIRTLELYRKNKAGIYENEELNQKIKLTPGIEVDTTEIMKSLNKVLSSREMRNAQMGGSPLRQVFGAFTGFLGMPSLEKSRAQADIVNQVMANIRDSMNQVLDSIQRNETALSGMEKEGTAKFTPEGYLTADSSSVAKKTLADLEEEKLVWQSILADTELVNKAVKSSGGDIQRLVKLLSFTSPILRENNDLIRNARAGLDKNGKALKFQTRTAEILNYTFQLMSRSIGQMLKNILSIVNPFNVIKKLFSDFMSYDTKWQRTMNVIKYNLRRIVRPMMEWIAQQLVNIIGLVNALIKGVGRIFGYNWDLFDQAAADTEKMHEELEAAANVSAGFDELHDIGSQGGSGNEAANDLMGDIYTPQWNGLYEKIEKFGEKVGEVIKKIRKAFENFNIKDFWKWLAIGGAALLGLKALKWLIEVFRGKNPLGAVASGLSFLEKAVGWSLLIWAFTEFTKALTDFVECMKTADWGTIAKSLILLGSAFALLFAGIAGVEGITKFVGITTGQLFGLSALVGVFDLFVQAIIPFINCIKELGTDAEGWTVIAQSLIALAGAFLTLIGGVAGLEGVTKLVGIMGPELAGLASLVGVFGLFVSALAPFMEVMASIPDGEKITTIASAIVTLAGAFGTLIMAISAVGNAAVNIPWGSILKIGAIALIFSGVVLILAQAIKTLAEEGEGLKAILEGLGEILSSGIQSLAAGIVVIIQQLADGITQIVTNLVAGIVSIIQTIGETINTILSGIANSIVTIIEGVANSIRTVLEPILEFIDSIISKITDLASVIAHEIGETIRTIIETVGNVIIGIVHELLNAVPQLLNSILNFTGSIGPAIENTVDAIIRAVTKLVNFVVSAVEYMVNLIIDGINHIGFDLPGGGHFGFNIPEFNIRRFEPQYEKGTNYVPNDGLAYLHQGEAVIPKKYNQPYQQQSLSQEERAYMQQMISTMRSLDTTMRDGIPVNGQFVQRGSDLVAVVNKTKSQTGADLLSNVAYAR